jgi:hypothetical protein
LVDSLLRIIWGLAPHDTSGGFGTASPRSPFLVATVIRGDLERCLIVAPGSLVEQWQDELSFKFGLSFDILTRDQVEAARTGNPFGERALLIARLDMLSRSDDLKTLLGAAGSRRVR